MTEVPQSNDDSNETSPNPEEEQSAPDFQAYLVLPTSNSSSRKTIFIIGACVLVMIIGLIIRDKPHPAQAKKPAIDFKAMASHELAQNASPQAARELVRRMYHGTDAERMSATSVIVNPSPRLGRNLAVAMSLELQKKQQENMRRMRESIRQAEQGY